MRISGGELKGRNIGSRKIFSKKADGEDLRPTSAKVREAVFNILRNEISGSVFLDLYAGSGTVGLEALSQGAEKVVFVESDRLRSAAISEMIKKLDLGDRAEVRSESSEHFLRNASAMTFDIIFADPPYASDQLEKIIPLISNCGILKGPSVLLCERAARMPAPGNFGTLKIVRHYRYGDTILTLYRKELQ